MRQVLSGAISARAIVWSAGLGAGAGRARTSGGLERAANSTFRTAHARDLAAFRDRRHDVAALLLTASAELVDAIAHRVGRLFHLWFFHCHEEQTRCARSTDAPPLFGLRMIELDWSAGEIAALQNEKLT